MLRPLLACLAVLAVGCGTAQQTPQPNTPTWTPPPDWVIVADGGGLRLAVPPSVIPWGQPGPIFANEAPPAPGAEIPFQLMALGPNADDQPAIGQDLAEWIGTRLAEDVGQGTPVVARIVLSAGRAVRYERVDRLGRPGAWHFVAFAVVTPGGVVYLQLDGPEAAWADHAAFPDQIASTLRYR